MCRATRHGIFGTVDSCDRVEISTGGRVHATDVSNASRTMLFDIHKRRWDAELLQQFGVSAESLPEVRASTGEFGTVDPELFGFSARIWQAWSATSRERCLRKAGLLRVRV